MNPATTWRLGVPVVCVLAGLLMATSATTAHGTDLRSDRRLDLADLIREQARRAAIGTEQVQQVRDEVDKLTQLSGNDDVRVQRARAEAGRLAVLAGLTPVVGPGLTVALDDAHRDPGSPLPSGVSPDDLVIHQQDVQAVVNALWVGGAEAVQVMDQRLLSTSAVRCVGNTLILGGRVYSPPFTISAVGDTARLRRALESAPDLINLRQWVDAVGLGYQVAVSRTLTIPAYEGPLALTHARTP